MPEPSADDAAPTPDTSTSRSAVTDSRNRNGAAPQRHSILSIAALVLAVIAVCLAAYAAFKPAESAPAEDANPAQPADSAQQPEEAKTTVCAAVETVRKGVTLNTNLSVPGGPTDVAGNLAVAANARLSLSEGGQYLLARLSPSTPGELHDAVERFANVLMDIGANATAGLPITDPAQAARLRDADAMSQSITGLCA
ncbi:hypothetical protein ACQI4L_06140 [Mycolicibacterium litorale]|uniref:hypothetical protein n=1 Tax=Mycolicibacterium litorale TaxID=758802 RepID=UPI003CEAF263